MGDILVERENRNGTYTKIFEVGRNDRLADDAPKGDVFREIEIQEDWTKDPRKAPDV